jgi:transglutaminase-like putative cysteine protease
MKRIRIIHSTEYRYRVPVRFGTHYVMLRPREGHDLHIAAAQVEVEPAASVRWRRDIYGNSIAILTFAEPADKLRVASQIDVDLYEEAPFDCLVDPAAKSYPFAYDADEQVELVPYRLSSYPHDGPALREWLRQLYQPGQLIDTYELLNQLNTRIFESFRYQYTFPAPAGVATIRRITNRPAPSMCRSPSPANRTRRCRWPVPGTGPPTRLREWTSRCKS